MNEEALSISIRKFLKRVGVTSQRSIEEAVAKAVADGEIGVADVFPATVVLEVVGLKLQVRIEGEIRLE